MNVRVNRIWYVQNFTLVVSVFAVGLCALPAARVERRRGARSALGESSWSLVIHTFPYCHALVGKISIFLGCSGLSDERLSDTFALCLANGD